MNEALVILQEQAAQVIQAASKIQRFGWGCTGYVGPKTNKQLLQQQLWDFIIIAQLAGLQTLPTPQYMQYKLDKLRKYSNVLP